MKNTGRVPLLVDGHLDLATNAITLNRNLTKTVYQIREKERNLGWKDFQDRGQGTVALTEFREGNIGLVFATIISRYSKNGCPLQTLALKGWHSPRRAYANAHICQVAGNSKHISFGSDLDGLFGLEQTPHNLVIIADLQKFNAILENRGYALKDRGNLYYGIWIRTLNRVLTYEWKFSKAC